MKALDLGVLILAGGEATRLPGKLESVTGSLPMIVRVYRNVCTGRPTFISCKATFPSGIDALLPCPMVVDQWPRRGPLAGLVSTMQQMRNRFVFAVAGDAPFVTSAFIDRLASEVHVGDEAIVPRHDEQLEPLAAIYDRAAFIRIALPLLAAGTGSLRHVIAALATRYVCVEADERSFTNINTPADYAAIHEVST